MAKKKIKFIHSIGENYSQTLPLSSEITVGKSFKNTVIETSLAYLPEKHLLFKKSGKEISLFVLKGMSGELNNDGLTISIDNLISTGQLAKRGNGFILKIPYDASGYLLFGENRLEFSFHEEEKKLKEKIKIDRSISSPLFDKRDNFVIFLIFSIIVHYSMVQYARSIKITETKIGDVAKVPQRLAKFILEPIPKKEQPVVPRKEKTEEKKESEKKEDKTKESKDTPEKEEEKAEEKKSQPKKEPVMSEKRQNIRAKIGTNALLGVFTSKEIEQKSDEIFSQIDSFLVDVTDLKAGKSGIAGNDPSTNGEVTSFEDISRGFDDFSKDNGKAVEYQKVVKRDGAEKIKLAEKETLKLESATKENVRAETEKARGRKKSSIDKVVQTYIGGLKFLYNRELRKDNSLRGKLVVKFTISSEGKVILAELVETTFENNELVQEMLKRIEKWKFPAEDVEDTTVVYPFVFMPVG